MTSYELRLPSDLMPHRWDSIEFEDEDGPYRRMVPVWRLADLVWTGWATAVHGGRVVRLELDDAQAAVLQLAGYDLRQRLEGFGSREREGEQMPLAGWACDTS